jgi:hypothetical protein
MKSVNEQVFYIVSRLWSLVSDVIAQLNVMAIDHVKHNQYAVLLTGVGFMLIVFAISYDTWNRQELQGYDH